MTMTPEYLAEFYRNAIEAALQGSRLPAAARTQIREIERLARQELFRTLEHLRSSEEPKPKGDVSMSTLTMAQTSVPRVAVANESTLVTAAESYNFTKSLQLQVRRDFAPIWGVDATVVATDPAAVAAYNWVLGIFDNSDQAGALGYHDLTPAGRPVMKIFAEDAQKAGVTICSVASHELLETLADAFIESLTLEDNGDGTGTLFSLEVCDPVQNDGYQIFGNTVSNFVTPWWFGDPLPPGLSYDFLQKLTAPFTMTPGGYFSSRQITKTGLQPWQQSFADERAKVLSKLSRGTRIHPGGSIGHWHVKRVSTRKFADL